MQFKRTFLALSVLAGSLGLSGCGDETTNYVSVPPPAIETPDFELTGNLKYVNPFIGTGFNGHTFAGSVVPEGMVQLSPDTELMGWHSSSGYHFDKDTLFGFSHTHLSGTGMGGLGDILFLPFTEANEKYIEDNDDYRNAISVKIDKTTEIAEAGYYSVEIIDNDIKAELTTSERVGFHRYTYPEGQAQKLKIDLNSILNSDWGSTSLRNKLTISEDGRTITGERDAAHFSGWAKNQKIFFHATFDKKIKNVYLLSGGKVVNGLSAEHISSLVDLDGDGEMDKRIKADVTAYIEFEAGNTQELNAQVALSAVSPEGAKANHAAEAFAAGKTVSFDKARANAAKKWQRALNFDVKGGTETQKEIFYTALYHTKIAPIVHQDVNGDYRGMGKGSLRNGDGEYSIYYGSATQDQPNFSVYSLWDTFRALHPLKTITEPTRAVQYAKNMVQKWKESGLLPKWEHLGDETGTMIGYPSVAVIADAITKFPNEFTAEEKNDALQAAIESTTYDNYQTLSQEWDQGVLDRTLGKQVGFSQHLGYVPVADESDENVKESVSYGLENAFYDWAVAQIAKAAGDLQAEKKYLERSQAFKQYFHHNPEEYAAHGVTGFMRPLQLDGEFIQEFDPYHTAHESGPYAEGNAWQWTWFVPHDLAGLTQKMGGKEAFADNLDATFTAGSTGSETADMSGMIGQVAFGNEPSHHIPYLYNWTNEAYKTQEVVDYILDEMYFAEPAGIIGNEDVGSMSAWYVMSAMGFYQVNAAEPLYTVGRPLFDEMRIPVKDGFFTIKAANNSDDNMYIKSVTVNGNPLGENFTFSHSEFRAGGEMKFVMTGDKAEAMKAQDLKVPERAKTEAKH